MTAAPVTGSSSDLAPEEEPVVVYDLFPAEVTTPVGIRRDARVIVTRERVYVYVGGRNRQPELLYAASVDWQLTTLPPHGKRRAEQAHLAVSGDAEPSVHITPTRSCGCSVGYLRGFTPWRPWLTGNL